MNIPVPDKLKSFLSSRAGIAIAVVAVLLMTILAAIPFAVKRGAISWLMKNGMAEARIHNVDFNPFAGTFAVEGVQLLAETGEKSSLTRVFVNLDMTDLVKKRVRIQAFELDGLNLVVDQGETTTLGGLALPAGDATTEPETPVEPEETPKKPWLVGIDALSISDTSVALSIPKLALRLDLGDVSLTDLHAWNPDEDARLEIKGAVNKSPLLISLDLTPFAAAPAVRGGIQLNKLSLNRFHRMAEPQVIALRGDLTIDTRIAVTHDPEKGTTLSQTGTLALQGIGGILEDQGVDLNHFEINWLGDLLATLDAEGNLTDLHTLGRLANTGLDTVLSQMDIRARHEGVVWDGEMRFQPQLDDGLTARGNLSVKNASATDTTNGNTLGALSNLFVYDLKARGLNRIRTPHISLKGLKAMPPLAGFGSIDMTGIAVNDLSTLRAETFIIGDVTTTIERDASGKLSPLKNLEALAKYQPPETNAGSSEAAPLPATPTPPAESAKPAFTVKIGTLRIKGDELILFTDHSVTPAFKKTIKLERFELQGFDSSDPKKDVPLIIEIELGPYETLTVTGTVRPLDPKVTAHLDVKIANINLGPLSPYSSQALGYLIEMGTFTIETKLDIDEGIMDVNNQLTLHKLELVPDEEDQMDKVLKSLTMPLDFALSILEDRNETINLGIPVKGDINDPDISVVGAISKAVTKAVTMASVSYLSYLLQPYGAVLMVADTAGDYATRIRLDPVAFNIESIQPTPASLDYLKVVSDLMKEKEVLKLTVCANAVTDDIVPEVPATEEPPQGEEASQHTTGTLPSDALQTPPAPVAVDKALYLDLARERGKAIREILIGHGIDPARILLCHPHFNVPEQEKPEAMLTL